MTFFGCHHNVDPCHDCDLVLWRGRLSLERSIYLIERSPKLTECSLKLTECSLIHVLRQVNVTRTGSAMWSPVILTWTPRGAFCLEFMVDRSLTVDRPLTIGR
jgi:hypothetical protein